MPSILRRSWPFRKRPAGPPDRAFRRNRAWFLLSYLAPVFVTVVGLLAAGGALADSGRDGRWITVVVGVVVALLGAYWWWRHHQPIYELFGSELWKGRRHLVDLADVERATVFNWRYRAPRSPLVGVLVVVTLVGPDGSRPTRLFGPFRLHFDEQREFHALLRSHGIPIEGEWSLGDTGNVIEGTSARRSR